MTQIRLPKSLKKYLRREKASIRRRFFDLAEQKKAIEELIKPFYLNSQKAVRHIAVGSDAVSQKTKTPKVEPIKKAVTKTESEKLVKKTKKPKAKAKA